MAEASVGFTTMWKKYIIAIVYYDNYTPTAALLL